MSRPLAVHQCLGRIGSAVAIWPIGFFVSWVAKVKRTRRSSSASAPVTSRKKDFRNGSPLSRTVSQLHTTSSAVTGTPSCQRASGCSANTAQEASSATVTLWASWP